MNYWTHFKTIWHIYPMIVYHSVYFAPDPDADLKFLNIFYY